MSNVYEAYVRNDDVVEWSKPMFPKVNHDLETLRADALPLLHVYDHVSIFKNGEQIEILEK